MKAPEAVFVLGDAAVRSADGADPWSGLRASAGLGERRLSESHDGIAVRFWLQALTRRSGRAGSIRVVDFFFDKGAPYAHSTSLTRMFTWCNDKRWRRSIPAGDSRMCRNGIIPQHPSDFVTQIKEFAGYELEAGTENRR